MDQPEILRETEHHIPGLVPGYVVVVITRIEKDPTLPEMAPPPVPAVAMPPVPAVVDQPVVAPQAIDINWEAVPQHPALPTLQSSAQFSREIPHPRDLQPRDVHHRGKFYTIFRGREVGIFYDVFTEVRPRVEGVPHSLSKSYKTWEEALMEYTRAYTGEKRGWEIAVINPENVAFPLEGETMEGEGAIRYWADEDNQRSSGVVIISDTESE
ncbi:hypothetical protein VNI00_018620 [Paramarasmius palmivorus]|uniref:Ribonuclease H1 N-terminal domain-containing protein n=1 Tax=Paramarasmius palmivorus TaxID=297713 RepID=A0AAW0AWU5_9AGAR